MSYKIFYLHCGFTVCICVFIWNETIVYPPRICFSQVTANFWRKDCYTIPMKHERDRSHDELHACCTCSHARSTQYHMQHHSCVTFEHMPCSHATISLLSYISVSFWCVLVSRGVCSRECCWYFTIKSVHH